MPLRTQLVHAEAGRRVVRASAWEAGECLGSALGEAATAEEAEDRAIERLRRRLALAGGPAAPAQPAAAAPADPATRITAATSASAAPASSPGSGSGRGQIRQPSLPSPPPAHGGPGATAGPPSLPSTSPAASPSAAPSASPLPPRLQAPPADLAVPGPAVASAAVAVATPGASAPEPPPDPEDWSDELAQVELELQRLGWGREQEAAYLERVFGHPSRGRLTRYADLGAYLGVLRRAPIGADPAALPAPLRRRDLLEQSDLLLGQLHWEAAQGRTFLERHFALSSRQQLSDEQLLHFNLLLEEEAGAGSLG
ncbi:hypothetical protein [Cyanobium sp. ATX 6F1]|uniref:hypothetical protein n=1 Tax=Cyanobium sp. ATX 6F1 TaxID=2823702 RepID=UPI0020CBCF09|nr:hypothetical protein [Cyanobium sp. ATX 6F1]MCP9914923.1 hypothetical protein [Cyanobium sp. ATX 6F1]